MALDRTAAARQDTCTPETYAKRRAEQQERKLVQFPEQLVAYDGCTAAAYTASAPVRLYCARGMPKHPQLCEWRSHVV